MDSLNAAVTLNRLDSVDALTKFAMDDVCLNDLPPHKSTYQ